MFAQWTELIITQDSTHFVTATTLLRNAGIAYRERRQNIGHSNRRNGEIGSLGENAGCTNLYQIYVKKADVAQAKAVLSNR